jgi:hypothetical protein
MKRNVFGALMTFIVAAALAVPVVHAQSSISLTANVPFAFSVDGKALPAGAYEVRDISSRATLIETKDGKDHVLGMYAYAGPSKPGESKLVFHRVGNNYFLAEIWSSNRGQGLSVPESKMEKEITASNRASGGSGAETVIVALR